MSEKSGSAGTLELVRAPERTRSGARLLSRDVHSALAAQRAETSGKALDAAITAAGSSNYAVARAFGVSEGAVRHIITGDTTLTWDRVIQLPRAVRRALLAAEIARCDEESPVAACPKSLALNVGARSGELAQEVMDAAADGFIDDREIARIEERAFATESAARVVRLAVRDGAGRVAK
jgi:hypothetical protein